VHAVFFAAGSCDVARALHAAALVAMLFCGGCEPELRVGPCHPYEDRFEGFFCELYAEPGATVTAMAGSQTLRTMGAELGFRYSELPEGTTELRYVAETSGVFGGTRSATVEIPMAAWADIELDVRPPSAVEVTVTTSPTFDVRLGGEALAADGRARRRTFAVRDLVMDRPLGDLGRDTLELTIPLEITGAGETRTLDLPVDLPALVMNVIRADIRSVERGGLPWARAAGDGGGRPTLVLATPAGAPSTVTSVSGIGAASLREVEWIALATDEVVARGDCGPYVGPGVTYLPRQRVDRSLSVYEARSGRHLGERAFRGDEPGSCPASIRQVETWTASGGYTNLDHAGHVRGASPDAAIARWLASLRP
jgi:hypothetical protein